MVKEDLVIEEKLLAKITPRVRQNFSTLFSAWVTVLDMVSQLLNMVNSLFTNKHSPSNKTYLAKSLLMLGLHVPSK